MRYLPLVLAAALAAAPSLRAQRGADGSTLVESAGIALVKPQPWSKESEATILEFTGYIDRTAGGQASAGYFEFRNANGQARQVTVGRLIRIVEYPDPNRVQELVDQSGRQRIDSTIEGINQIIARFPATKPYLAARTAEYAKLGQMYDSGKVRYAGEWIPRRAYLDAQADKVGEILETEIQSARPPGSFRLDLDPRFTALSDMADESSKARSEVARLKSMQAQQATAERRRQIAGRLADAETPLAACRKLLDEAAKLPAGDDAAADEAIAAWSANLLRVEALAKNAGNLAPAIEAAASSAPDPAKPPSLDPDTAKAAAAVADELDALRNAGVPPQLLPLLGKAEAVATASAAYAQLRGLMSRNALLDAKVHLDALAAQAEAIGPQTVAVVAAMQRTAADRITVFERLREEARVLAEGGKKAEALAKFEEAHAIIPDEAVAERIAELKPTPAGQ